jgi:hypothetical protein
MEEPMRCLRCGSCKQDAEGCKCGNCGGAMGLRSERVYVSRETLNTLLTHASEFERFGLRIEPVLPSQELQKSTGGDAIALLAVVAAVVTLTDSYRSDTGTIRALVGYLCDLAVPKDDILALRLDEPEKILTYCDESVAKSPQRWV